MTTIDGVPGRWRLRLPGVAQAPAEALAAAEGCTVPELVAQLILDAHAKIATDAATSSAGAVSPGQGEANPPAPMTDRVLVAAPANLDRLNCTWSRAFCATPARWFLTSPSEWKRGHPYVGAACCDDHIPEGWVRPDEVAAPTNGRAAYALDLHREGERLAREADRLTAMKAAGHVPAHVHLDGGPCVYGERCGQ